MRIFKIIWQIIKGLSVVSSVIGIIGMFADIESWGSLMITIAPYITTLLFQSLSVVLLVLLIVDITLKYQHKISYLNPDLMLMMRNKFSKFKKQRINSEQKPLIPDGKPRIKPSIDQEKSNQQGSIYKQSYEQDFNEFAEHRDAGSAPDLQPDAYMSDAIDYLINILFPDRDPRSLDYQNEFPTTVNEITAKLRTGELKSWGLFAGESVERKFNKDVWQYRELLPLEASISTEKNTQTKSVTSNADQHPLTGLRVNMSQVKDLWREDYRQPNIQARKEFVMGTKSNKHNVSLLEAIFYIATGKWDNVHELTSEKGVLVSDEEIGKITKAWRDLEQAAIDGDIRIWGKNSKDHWILITDNTYWQRHWICWTQVLTADEENDWSFNEVIGVDVNDPSKNDDLYHKYNTSIQDIEKLWQ